MQLAFCGDALVGTLRLLLRDPIVWPDISEDDTLYVYSLAVTREWAHRRERLLASDVASAFFDAVVTQARAAGLLSDEHVTVARTQLDAWASRKSVPRPEAPRPPPDDPGNPTVHVHGARRSQATSRSTTDPDAPLVRKGGAGAVRSALGHVVLDHRHGLVVTPCVTAATGPAEWDAVEMLLADVRRGTVAGDKNDDRRRGVRWLRGQGLTPPVAAKRPCSAIDRRTTRHPGRSEERRVGKECRSRWSPYH